VCDVARPHDAPIELRRRGDVTVIDGGLVALPDPTARFGVGNLQGYPDGIQLACLSETIVLALAGETADRGIGDDIPVSEAERMLALAAQHGFSLAAPSRDREILRRLHA
jgi:predicted amino acid dehydrogenase